MKSDELMFTFSYVFLLIFIVNLLFYFEGDNIFKVFFLLIPLVLALDLIFVLSKRQLRKLGRINLNTSYLQAGGVRAGKRFLRATSAPWPLARLIVSWEGIILSTPWENYRFRPEDIEKLSSFRGLLFSGLRISHFKPDYPQFIVFWTFSFGELKSNLDRFGYIVTG